MTDTEKLRALERQKREYVHQVRNALKIVNMQLLDVAQRLDQFDQWTPDAGTGKPKMQMQWSGK